MPCLKPLDIKARDEKQVRKLNGVYDKVVLQTRVLTSFKALRHMTANVD
jgi:hypothetical protein